MLTDWFVCLCFVVFKPIFASAKMCINPNAEQELKTPKAKLHLEVQNIAIEMTKPQVTRLAVCQVITVTGYYVFDTNHLLPCTADIWHCPQTLGPDQDEPL